MRYIVISHATVFRVGIQAKASSPLPGAKNCSTNCTAWTSRTHYVGGLCP